MQEQTNGALDIEFCRSNCLSIWRSTMFFHCRRTSPKPKKVSSGITVSLLLHLKPSLGFLLDRAQPLQIASQFLGLRF